jgi:5-methylcytosine-specific restriction endonuclease McrA
MVVQIHSRLPFLRKKFMSDTLVLDTQGYPIAFVSWQRAVNLQWQDRAVVVAEDAQRILRSPSFEMGLPRVIKLRNHISRKLRLKVPMTRRNIAIRDHSSCQYCGVLLETSDYSIDHVVPRSRGGQSVWANLVLACVHCNRRKSDRLPHEVGLTLRQKPVAPNQFDPRFNFRLHIKVLRPEWSDYKAYIYWNVELEK